MKKIVKTLIGAILATNMLFSTTLAMANDVPITYTDQSSYDMVYTSYANLYHYSPSTGLIQSEEGKSLYSYNCMNKDIGDLGFLGKDKVQNLENLIRENPDLKKAYIAFYVKTHQQQKSGTRTLDAEDTYRIVKGENKIENFTGKSKYTDEYNKAIKKDIELWKDLEKKLTLKGDIYNDTIKKEFGNAYLLADRCCFAWMGGVYFDDAPHAIFNYINPKYNKNEKNFDNSNSGYFKKVCIEQETRKNDCGKELYLRPYDYVVDMDYLVNKSSAKELCGKNIEDFQNWIESNYDEISSKCKSGPVYLESGDIVVCDFDDNLKKVAKDFGFQELYKEPYKRDLDGFLAIGDSRGGMKAKVTCKDNKLNVDLDYYLDDYYNYNIYDKTEYGNGDGENRVSISEQGMAILHMAGVAREYRMIGKSSIRFGIEKIGCSFYISN